MAHPVGYVGWMNEWEREDDERKGSGMNAREADIPLPTNLLPAPKLERSNNTQPACNEEHMSTKESVQLLLF